MDGSARRPLVRLAETGSSSSNRHLPRRVLNSPSDAEEKSCNGGAPQLSGE
jgi:hypothetical protein